MKFVPRKPDGVKRAPLRTFAELVEEVGVSPHKVIQAFRLHPEGAPQPKFVHRNSQDTGRKTWYERDAFLKWWKGFNE